jgi:hypothetical protein
MIDEDRWRAELGQAHEGSVPEIASH